MARPAKPRASDTLNVKRRMSTAKPVYSTTEPTLEEKLLLPERFRKADEWPVTEIVAEKAGKYLVEWEPHPNTGAVWKPEWVCGLHPELYALRSNYVQRKAADVSDDLIARWKERKRKEKHALQKSAHSPSGSKQFKEDWEQEGPLKRRRLTRHTASSDTTSVRASTQDTTASGNPQTPITRSRQSRLVILSSSPSTEIQETQQQSLSTTDSIQVNVPQDNHINREEYQSISNSSASFELPASNHVSSASTKDQEADSALGLSSPIGDVFAPAPASTADRGGQEPKETSGSRSSLSTSHIPASSTQSVRPQNVREVRRASGRQATTAPVQISDPIESTPNSIEPSEGGDPATNTAASSPLFYPDPQEELRESNADAVHSLTPSQDLARNRLVDTSAQQPVLGATTSQTRNDLLPISISSSQGGDIQTQRSESSVFATPSPVVRHPSIRRSASQSLATATRESGKRHRTPPQSHRDVRGLSGSLPRSPPVRRFPRAKLFQRLNLSSNPQPRTRSMADTSPPSRESSPRVRRSAPPVERSTPSSSLRETLIKQTAPARALQQARHERAANRSTSRATSAATDSTRASIPARTANSSPMHSQTNMSSNLPSDQGSNSNGGFSSSMQVDESEPALVSSIAPAVSVYNSALGSSALPLHPSIEDEQSLPHMMRLGLSSSPILGPGEYVVPLPAEGKIKDHYLECIRSKRRSLMKFIRNPKSTGRVNVSRINVCFRQLLIW
jgi:hypothetical protein